MANPKVRYRFGQALHRIQHQKKALLFFNFIGKFSTLSLPHNRQVPCSSQGRATIFLIQIIELPHTRRLIDFGSQRNTSEKHPARLFLIQSAAAWSWSLLFAKLLGHWNFGWECNCGTLMVVTFAALSVIRTFLPQDKDKKSDMDISIWFPATK